MRVEGAELGTDLIRADVAHVGIAEAVKHVQGVLPGLAGGICVAESMVGRSAPSFPDSGFVANSRCGLLFQILVVDLLRGPVLKSGVPTLRIVPEFDVPHNVAAGMFASRILGTVDALVLKRSKERLGHRIIVAYTGTADGLPEVMYLQRPGELTGRVIAAAIRMENSTLPQADNYGRPSR